MLALHRPSAAWATFGDTQVVAVRPDPSGENKQGLGYFVGVSAETAGSTAICAHLVTIPPGGRAKAHLHEAHETILYVWRARS